MKLLLKDGENTSVIEKHELDLVAALTNGATIAQIGQDWNINKRTMEGRVIRLKAKTGCKSLCELVALFFRNKLIE